AEGAARGKRKLRILVADDERDQVMTLAAILQDEGHEVREVYRGTEVLRMVRDFDPDIALIDIGMPGMSGYEVARELRQEFGKQRVDDRAQRSALPERCRRTGDSTARLRRMPRT